MNVPVYTALLINKLKKGNLQQNYTHLPSSNATSASFVSATNPFDWFSSRFGIFGHTEMIGLPCIYRRSFIKANAEIAQLSVHCKVHCEKAGKNQHPLLQKKQYIVCLFQNKKPACSHLFILWLHYFNTGNTMLMFLK